MKKLLSIVMVMAMVVSATSMSVGLAFAGEKNSAELEKAITVVKKAVDIPADMEEFSHYYNEESDGNYTISLNWSSPKNDSYISVVSDREGLILSYYAYLPEFEGEGLGKVTEAQAEKNAEGYLKSLFPKPLGTFKKQKSLEAAYGSDYMFNYKMYVNDIPCDFINVNMNINKYTGKLARYNCNADSKILQETEYPTKDGALSKEDGKKAYITELGPSLKYYSYYDYVKKSLKVFPAYMSEQSKKAIDAKTGKVVDLYVGPMAFQGIGGNTAADKEERSDGGVSFTAAELKEIQKTKGLIEKESADKTARNLIPILKNQKLNSASLALDRGPNQEYVWSLNYEDGYVNVDAKTGGLFRFYQYKSDNGKTARDIGLEKAKSTAEAFLDKAFLENREEIQLREQDNSAEDIGRYIFLYERKVNDIAFPSNVVSISIEKSTGDIIAYYNTWYKNANFPSIEKAISKEAAFDQIDKISEFGLTYKKDRDNKTILVYDFLQEDGYMLDANKGIRLDYKGAPYVSAVEYTDIKGNWAEKTILELKNNGYYLEGDKFMPKQVTTQLEFFRYLFSPQRSYYGDTNEFYEMLIRSNIITKEEANPQSKITRQEAAKFATRYLNLDKLAKHGNVFKNMYTDKIEADYQGYAATAYALGIMKGDAKGRFNGTSTLSHAETATVIFNILNNN